MLKLFITMWPTCDSDVTWQTRDWHVMDMWLTCDSDNTHKILQGLSNSDFKIGEELSLLKCQYVPLDHCSWLVLRSLETINTRLVLRSTAGLKKKQQNSSTCEVQEFPCAVPPWSWSRWQQVGLSCSEWLRSASHWGEGRGKCTLMHSKHKLSASSCQWQCMQTSIWRVNSNMYGGLELDSPIEQSNLTMCSKH